MKVTFAVGFKSSGSVLELDTETNQSRKLFWSAPIGSDVVISLFLKGPKVCGALARSGPTIYKAFVGEALPDPAAVTVTAIGPALTASREMQVSPDGLFSVGVPGSGFDWAVINFSGGTPTLTSHAAGSFPTNVEMGMMSFDDGSSRLVYINGDQQAMYLSTELGRPGSIDIALTLPIPEVVPFGQDYNVFAANGAVSLGRLGAAAKSAGLGSPTVYDQWIIASLGPNGIYPGRVSGACTHPDDSGAQVVGYIDGFTLKELVVQSNFNFTVLYSQALPDDLISGQGISGVFFDVVPAQKKLFWTKFVRSFEDA
ncbi:hypothetical protein KDX38_11055 [Pseudomonas sp. CDFA 602]|uniref:hypothetical protein n=1 Tax=Pseudomonas californiensis TaxID=2829823 RepID=UPI001E500770|nr:hypothetical protein [Pseudomonas californiensis]MCD5994144.1 hypothetical protein [Pseudomonas californiensis]MCD5999757.1 hypothetical protein [Pseudomonas californiensis]